MLHIKTLTLQIMKEEIKRSIDNPGQLEKLYRGNKHAFKSAFNSIYPDIQEKTVAQVWHERLNCENEEILWGNSKELFFLIAASIVAGLIAKIPEYTSINEEFFYPRNIAFVFIPLLITYFSWREKIQIKKIAAISTVLLVSIIYINLLPDSSNSDTLKLACIHLPLFLWTVLGFTFIGGNLKDHHRRIDFLRYNGDLVVMTTLMLIAGILLAVITIGLFNLIDIKIEEFYFKYIVIWGLAASPIVGTYLVQNNPDLVNKVSPVIAKVFTPLVFATLVIYLIAVIVSGKDPYNDRDFLLIFNLLLIGVMAIILFSIAETSQKPKNQIGAMLLFGLSTLTILVNGIALSAILYRISEWGITPNRLAVLGSNILILLNLLMMTYRLFRTITDRKEIENVTGSIAIFLPIYSLWTIIVTFIFPLLFDFK